MIKVILGVGVGLAIITGGILHAVEQPIRTVVQQVKDGELILRCEFEHGARDVDPNMVLDFERGRWDFKNGSASSCILVVMK